MNVIDHNPDKTVGIVSGVTGLTHIGGFSPKLLGEWMLAIEAAFDLETVNTIHLFTKKSSEGDNYAIFACADGEDPLVALAGLSPKDDKPWGKVYAGCNDIPKEMLK